MRSTLFILWLLSAIPVYAQSDSLHIYSMQEVYQQNNWLTGANPVGMSFNRFRSFSVAEVGYRFEDGNFGNVSLPASSNKYAVFGESYQTIGNVSLYGKIGYVNNRKQEVNWNGMTGDCWRGINLCDSVSGDQRSEQYQLSGAFSLPVSSHWLIGSRFDYLVDLNVKDADPRNENQWMEWRITPGVGYEYGNHRLGASIFYGNRKETVDYQNIGTHTTYPFFVSYPLGYFKTLPKGENIKWYYSVQELGGFLQEEGAYGRFRLFQQIGGNLVRQNIVSDRIQNKKESETDGWKLDYKGIGSLVSSLNRHEWSWKVLFDKSDSYDLLQQQEENMGTWHSSGKVLRSTARINEYGLTYGYYRLYNEWNSRCSIVSGIEFKQTKSQLLFYPAEYTQTVHRFTAYSTFTRNFLLSNARIDLAIGAEYGKGGGTMIAEKQLQSGQNTPAIKLWQNMDRLEQEYNYLTEPRWALHLSLTYTHIISFTWFSRLTAGYENASKKLFNSNKENISVQIGLFF